MGAQLDRVVRENLTLIDDPLVLGRRERDRPVAGAARRATALRLPLPRGGGPVAERVRRTRGLHLLPHRPDPGGRLARRARRRDGARDRAREAQPRGALDREGHDPRSAREDPRRRRRGGRRRARRADRGRGREPEPPARVQPRVRGRSGRGGRRVPGARGLRPDGHGHVLRAAGRAEAAGARLRRAALSREPSPRGGSARRGRRARPHHDGAGPRRSAPARGLRGAPGAPGSRARQRPHHAAGGTSRARYEEERRVPRGGRATGPRGRARGGRRDARRGRAGGAERSPPALPPRRAGSASSVGSRRRSTPGAARWSSTRRWRSPTSRSAAPTRSSATA